MKFTNAATNAAISTGRLEPRVTTNPRHKSPLPLYPEPTTKVENPEKVKLKLRKDPTKAASGTYEKEYILFDGITTEEYCNFRATLDHYIENAGINTIPAKVAAVSQLTTKNARDNWNTAIQLFTDDHDGNAPTNEDEYDQVMTLFSFNYASDNSRQEQKRFMNRVLSKPKDLSVQTFWMRLNSMNRMLPYLPGTGGKFPKDQLRDMLVHAMPQWQRDIMTQSNFKWDDPTKQDTQIIQYLEKLRLIESVRENSKMASKKTAPRKQPPHKRNDANNQTKFKTNGGGNGITCHYCHKYGHKEADCRKKKRDEANAKSKAEQHTMEVEDHIEELHSIDDLIDSLPNEEDQTED